ncbi:MAG: biotin transporter BioY [Acidimicrobiales bacterium]
MTAIGAIPTRTTLIDTIPRSVVRDVVAVVGFALLTAGAAQVSFSLGFTPVPISGQTFAVLLAGGALGSQLGAASQLLYVAMGAIGLPFYTDAQGGWDVATGSTAGYLVGFIVAAYAVGWLAERGQDRQLATSITAFVAGSVIIYVLGVAWLSYDLDIPITAEFGEPSAIAYGVTPFVVGDILKAVLAGALLPAAWRLAKR